MITNQNLRWMRWIALVLVLINIIPMLNSGAIHALCPYGGLEIIYTFNFKSTSILLLILTILLTLLFRRSFCGLICPLGALQEFVGKFQKNRWVIPTKIDKFFRYCKYVVLIVTLYGAWTTLSYWWIRFDPYFAYGLIVKNMSGISPIFIFGIMLLLFSLLGSFLLERFFCKYFCPLGAFYAVIGYFSPTRVDRNQKTCINCKLCTKICPVNIDVAKETEILSVECINCNECVNICPKEGALRIKIWKAEISVLVIFVLTYIIFFGGIILVRSF